MGRLVQADRRGDGTLKSGQALDVIGGHRLFEHEEVVLIQLAEQVDIRRRVSRVRVDHQFDFAEVLADGTDQFEILAGPDLDLDPTIARIEMGFDRLDQFDDARIETHGQARLDPLIDPQLGGSE